MDPLIKSEDVADEDAIAPREAFRGAISCAAENFFEMDEQAQQEELEQAQENHPDLLNAIIAFAK